MNIVKIIELLESVEITKEGSLIDILNNIILYYKESTATFDEGKICDKYHTFDELYEFRKVYNAALFNEWAKNGRYDVHKSKRHYDGELCFGDDKWFVVVAMLPTGQITNHYKVDTDWNLFNIPETPKAKYEFDGHTPKDVIDRLKLTPETCLRSTTRTISISKIERVKKEYHYLIYLKTSGEFIFEGRKIIVSNDLAQFTSEEMLTKEEAYNKLTGSINVKEITGEFKTISAKLVLIDHKNNTIEEDFISKGYREEDDIKSPKNINKVREAKEYLSKIKNDTTS